jgi:antitoxin component YwqK of YwqJK toxin-antitoxin module
VQKEDDAIKSINMKISFCILLILATNKILAQDIKNVIERSDYASLIRVTKILDTGIASYKIEIVELEHYKGKYSKEMVIEGNLRVIEYDSNQRRFLPGEEYLILTNYKDSIPFLAHNNLSINNRERDGFRDWQYPDKITAIEKYRKFFNDTVTTSKGERKTYYPNGGIEKIENFSNGQINGDVRYFYPNGNLYGKGNYKKGKKEGRFYWYDKKGQIQSQLKYRKGIQYDTATYFLPYAMGLKPHLVQIFNKKGDCIKVIEYSGGYKVYCLSSIDLYNRKKHTIFSTHYFCSGQIREKSFSKNNKLRKIIDYDEKGNIMRMKEFDENENLIKSFKK